MAHKSGEKSPLTTFLLISFVLGTLLGAVIASIWIQGPLSLQLEQGKIYTRSITIVGVDKQTGQGRLARMVVEIRAGTGRLLIEVPPYEIEDTQQAALDARSAAEQTILRRFGRGLSQVDIAVSIKDIAAQTTIAGPSASASISALIVAAAYASENVTPNEVRQDVVVSAAINSTGELQPVGEIVEKYRTVREAGGFTRFVVAQNQPGYLPDYRDIKVERALNLNELLSKILW